MQLCKLSNQFPAIQDIALYLPATKPVIVDSNLRTSAKWGSSLEGRRSIADFFKILDYVIHTTAGDHKLQKLNDTLTPLADPPIERSSPGTITAGIYLILPSVEGGPIFPKTLLTFSNTRVMGAGSPSMPAVERVKSDGDGSTASGRPSRDPSDDSQSFKMRLVHRDKGCAVFLAAGIQKRYRYQGDSNRFKGAHIIPFAHHKLWDAKGFSVLISDPFTDPANADGQLASPSTRTKKDLRRINSLENGILLCLEHHKDYYNFRFAIHPETHKIFAFHPDITTLHDIEVKAPWDSPNVLLPSPLSDFLEMHYFTSIAKAMKGNGDDYELDVDDDDDYECPSELEETSK